MTALRAPPPDVLRALAALEHLLGLGYTNISRCAKSKRACVVFDPLTGNISGKGWNEQPDGIPCDGSEECRRDCAKLCIHAEAMAITEALCTVSANLQRHVPLDGLQLVHGKFVNGQLVEGGGPSCWQCSKQVLESGLDGVWLYIDFHAERLKRVAAEDPSGMRVLCDTYLAPQWRFYTAAAFHEETLKACGLHRPVASR